MLRVSFFLCMAFSICCPKVELCGVILASKREHLQRCRATRPQYPISFASREIRVVLSASYKYCMHVYIKRMMVVDTVSIVWP